MRFTFVEAEAPERRSGVLVWMRRIFDLLVIGAMVLAGVETISFLRGLVG
ncbi:hypothetical protein [Phenylobacterium sp.]